MKASAMAFAVAGALALAAPVDAQQQRQQGAQGMSQAQGKQGQMQQGEQRKGIIAATGKVTDVRQLKTKQGDTHQIVKLQTLDGSTLIVNLGAGKAQFGKGDRIFVSGRAGRINGKPVVFARYAGELQQVGQIGKGQKQAGAQGQGKAAVGATGQRGASGASGQQGGQGPGRN